VNIRETPYRQNFTEDKKNGLVIGNTIRITRKLDFVKEVLAQNVFDLHYESILLANVGDKSLTGREIFLLGKFLR